MKFSLLIRQSLHPPKFPSIQYGKVDLNILVLLCKEEKCEENLAGMNISRSTTAISFNFHMLSGIYVRQIMYKLDRN